MISKQVSARQKGKYVEIIDRKEAIAYAIHHGQPGDIIVLAGKGHEDYQEIKGKKYPMDERVLIREILEEDAQEKSMIKTYADIIVDITSEKLDRSFQYLVPQHLEGRLQPGMQVQVPFRKWRKDDQRIRDPGDGSSQLLHISAA